MLQEEVVLMDVVVLVFPVPTGHMSHSTGQELHHLIHMYLGKKGVEGLENILKGRLI